MDEDNVQSDVVPEGTALPETGDLSEGGEPKQPLTEAEKTRQMVQEAVDKVLEGAKREIQSVKDKATAEVDRALNRASLAEGTLAGVNKGFSDLDPEAAESARLKAQLRAYQQRDVAMQESQFRQTLEADLKEHLQELDIDINDERIDWAKERGVSFRDGQKRFNKSIADILKGNTKVAEDKVKQEKKEAEAKEADSVDTSVNTGGMSNAEFLKKYGNYEIPSTKANVDRYNRIQEQGG